MQGRTLHPKDAHQVPTCPLRQVVTPIKIKLADTVDFSNTTVDSLLSSLIPAIDFVETDLESLETIHWTGLSYRSA